MTLSRYIIGYILSLALTAASFGAVWLHYIEHHRFPTHQELFAWIAALAAVQAVVQIVFFLHVGRRSSGRDLFSLALAAVFVAIAVGGSVWIMTNLNGRMMPSQDQMIQYMQDQDSAM